MSGSSPIPNADFRRHDPVGSRQRGVALVLVLAVIVMLTILVVGMLMVAKNGLRTASRYVDAFDARMAADSALRIVEAQLREATLSGIGGDGRGTYAWASQPGAARVFDNTGALKNIFKLYSSDQMITSDPASLAMDVPVDWNARPDEYVDLNEPVKRAQWIYPIASPDSLLPSPDAVPTGNQVAGFYTPQARNNPNWDDRLAMPVRWLYIQKDGSMTTDPAIGDPILRVAFWTDDESSKINLNTASASDQNSYWDIPRVTSTDDLNLLAWAQPDQNEFNRYPGHPATVSLKTVFPDSTIQDLIKATPRYQWGGSENATKRIGTSRTPLGNSKNQRLYATADECLYDSNRTSQLGMNASALAARRFFLTSASRSPDLNLFGQPRVTIWPIHASTGDGFRTPYDRTIAFCSTIGSTTNAKPYYFIRSNPLSQTDDWTLHDRNQKLFQYIQAGTSREIPGFGGNFLDKYDTKDGGVAGERDQILTEIFDYIRCTNLNDTNRDQPSSFATFTTKLRDASGTGAGSANVRTWFNTYAGAGFVLPIRIASLGTRGAGRVPVISEVGIWLIQTKSDPPENADPNPPEVQAALPIETFSPMQGYMPWIPHNISFQVRNIPGSELRIRDKDGQWRTLFPDSATVNFNDGPNHGLAQGQPLGGIDGFAWPLAAATQPAAYHNIFNSPLLMQKANAIPLAASATSVEFSGGEIEISLRCDSRMPNSSYVGTSGGTTFQTYRIQFFPATLPVPVPVAPSQAYDGPPKRYSGWFKRQDASPNITHFRTEDVVRGVADKDGDYRIVACLQNVSSNFFESATTYTSSLARVHSFRAGQDFSLLDTSNGSYVPLPFGKTQVASYPFFKDSHPKIPQNITSLRGEGWEGDFDNGMGDLVDGPYLNKPDEGALASSASNAPYFTRLWKLGDGLFSPLRQVPSAVMFGSLPTGVKRTEQARDSGSSSNAKPWRTLNFCPNPLSKSNHYGLQNPPDHLLLDLFTMPIVEPYAISEPFSTAGRLNMNCQIVPFSYIKRQTALYAALASQKVAAIANSSSGTYKSSSSFSSPGIRFSVNVPETLKQFDKRFGNNDIFRSASEICGTFFVPVASGVTADTVAAWWDSYELTGNNTRERPYATLYPLLTTKSNVFCTHVRAQAIKRLASGRIVVKSEYRGSVLFERYLDPNDPVFSEGTVDPDQVSLEPYYRFRTLVSKQMDL